MIAYVRTFAIDLANTWDPYFADPETLGDAEAALEFLHMHSIDPDGATGAHVLRCLRALRARLHAILLGSDGPADLTRRLNEFLETVDGTPTVALDADHRARIELAGHSRRLDERLAVIAANDMLALSLEIGPHRIRSCSADPCVEIFVDTSRNGRRRFCSKRCSNRAHAARHRQRAQA